MLRSHHFHAASLGLAIPLAMLLSFTVVADHHKGKKGKKDIVDTAVAADGFETLVKAVKAAALVEVLKSEGPFTVFAPTDDAFAELPEEKLNSLLRDKEALASVLKYHVVPGKVMASDVVQLDSAETALGEPVSIQVKDDKVFVNDARVIKTDIECTNGVIHVINSVLLPPQQ